ncbi:MAG: ATP-grasp domain-containing protein [Limosilactobacillus sp.]|jgi:5-(carboxyamino)imidazole ribonucleotide synthase|uniref:ATP-grasp domain-containing protein n=1 Tax=Limosilactobacillus sp. TaxID=2773925 RepID=UPI0025C28F9D|nr:ATP-grasp domain-containing protein [Limosilactobacillus sp.]MCI1975596.1 ATP-grasp domain-containing protein [Limosilactobacillus sp.]MCI2030687.1 ATP-grasp domain-containing protein [Limosilactobacillus sp.]
MSNTIFPGSTLGIIGINRNGVAMIAAAKKAGFNVGVYVDHSQPDVTKMADFTIDGAYNDKEKLIEFGEACDAIIYQTPNIDSTIIRFLGQYATLPQGINGLEIVQDRLMERAFLDQININIAPYVTVIGLDDVYQSIDSIGYPALLKPIQRGIGEQSMMIKRQSDITRAADFIDTGTYLLESWIDHTAEYTLTAACEHGDIGIFPLAQLEYSNDRRLISVAAPAEVSDDMLQEMHRIIKSVADSLQYNGVFSVNFYVTSTGTLYVKNIELGLTSIANVYDNMTNVDQYEQQLRASVGMPLHVILPLQTALLMVIRNYQATAIQRQWLLKNNWKFRFFNNADTKDPSGILGFVWVTGDADLEALRNQVDDTEVWNKPTPSEDDASQTKKEQEE